MKLVQYYINPCQSCDQIANLLRGMDLSHIHWEKVDTSNLALAHLQKKKNTGKDRSYPDPLRQPRQRNQA